MDLETPRHHGRAIPTVTRRAALGFLATGAAALLAACSSPALNPPAGAASGSTAGASAVATGQSSPVAQAATSAPAAAQAGGQAVGVASPAASPATAASGGQPPVPGGTLRVGVATDITSLEPHFSLSWTTSETTWLPYDRLTQYDLKLRPQPMLAESWDFGSDAKQIKLNLRKGVTWHTGREFTSDDVKYTLTRILDPAVGNGQFTNQSKWFPSIDTPDKYTVILTSDQPRPTVFDFFEYLNIVDKETLEGPDARLKSVGTGPFSFLEWSQGDHLTLAKYPNYWQSGKPYLEGVRVNFFKDAQAMLAQLEAGALDMVTIPPRRDYVRLKADPQYQGIVHPNGGSWYTVGVNTTVPPFDQKTVRQALNYAINRQRFVDTTLLGVGTAQDLIWSEGSPAYEADKVNNYPFDLDQAKSLLASAGVKNVTADILPLPGLPEGPEFAQIYQADLAQLGININIVSLDTAGWVDQVNNRKYNGLYWAQLATPGAQLSPGSVYLAGRATNPAANNSGFSTPEYAQLVDAANTEIDPTKLKQIYSQLNDIVLDESFIAPMSPNLLTKIATAKVHDVTPNMHNGWLYTDTWMH